ncbi:MAG TPA: hypothetical protein VGS79_11345 [Puia sp.]|nr:hypothetical protein [Puia sp.]
MKTAVKKKRAKPKKVVKKMSFKDEDDIPDLRNDPFFVKKAEEAKEMLRRSGVVLDESAKFDEEKHWKSVRGDNYQPTRHRL